MCEGVRVRVCVKVCVRVRVKVWVCIRHSVTDAILILHMFQQVPYSGSNLRPSEVKRFSS